MTSDYKQKPDTVNMHLRGVRIVSSYIPRFFTAIALHSFVTAVTPCIRLWMFARILDCLVRPNTSDVWLWVSVLLVTETVMTILQGALRRFKEAKWERLYRVADRIVADKLLSLNHADLDDHDTQKLLERVRVAMSELDGGLVQIPQIVQHLLLGIFGTAGAALLSWQLFAMGDMRVTATIGVALLITAAVGLWFKVAARRHKDTKTDEVVSLDRLYYTFYNTMFDAAKAADVRLYRQDESIERYLTSTDRTFFDKKGLKHVGRGGMADGVSAGLSAMWIGLACTLAVTSIPSCGGLVRSVGAFWLLWSALDNIVEGVYRLGKNTAHLQTALAFLDIPHRLYQGSLTTEKRADRDYELEFRHVSFRYPSQSAYALKDVSVVFRAGSRTAIVGENGSGKSTFVKLLCRLYDPEEGEILLNGIDIRKYRYAEYMAVIAVVLQDFRLLAQPLGNTVAGADHYDSDRVWKCLDDASFDRHAPSWERGLDTPLYRDCFESGVSVSSGDAQKIAIASALYKNAPFMILDEPTAALDPVTEAEIYANFDRIVGDRTALYVSHRLSSCRFCDEILVFDRGTVVQRGTHEELLCDANGKYHELWHAQAQYYMT